MEPNGEFLLQLLQGGGGGGGNGRSNSGGGGRRGNGASSSEDVEGSSAWQHRDPAVAALGPSHSYHVGEPLLQQQPNQLFMAPPPYGGGVWTPSPHQQQQQHHHHHHHQLQHQQQQQQFFGFGGNRLQSYPPPPSAQLTEPWRSDATPGWLPPPRASDGVARPWSQGSSSSMPKAPQPQPPQQQQFLGDGAELLQLLLGGNSQNLKPLKNPPLGPGEHLGEGRTVPVDHGVPRAQVHGPIGPPKRSDQLEPPPVPLPAGGEDLLGRLWALSNGSPEPLNKPIVSLPEERMRALTLTGGLDASKTIPSKSKGSKPPGFFGERDGMPVEPTFGASTALNQFSGGAKGPLAWESFQDGTATGLKQESHAVRPSDDRGNYQMPPNASRFVGAARNREDGHSKASGQARDPTSLPSADASESSPSRELGRGGARGSGRRGGLAGRAEMGRRSNTGQWVAVNEKPRDRDSEREGSTSNLHGADGSASADGDASGSAFASPPSAKATAASSGKDESPNGSSSGGKSKEDMKRRRGQQEWRMKQASPPHSKPSAEPGSQGVGELSQQDRNAEDVLPLASQVDRPGLPSNTVRHSMPGSATDESKQQLQYQLDEGVRSGGRERAGRHLFENGSLTWEDGLGGEEEEDPMRELNFSGYAKLVEDAQLLSATPLVTQSAAHLTVLTREETELEEKPGNVRDSRDVRRHQQRMNVSTNLFKGDVQRLDFETFNPQLLAIYKSLIPSQEEVQRQEKFLTRLDRLVSRDWGCAKLFLFGSCANDFGVRNSDIDICLSVDDEHSSKAELVTKMAAILRSDDMQNVQALTHARVPIVKFTDPDTGINCDICVNNMLAVVNSKLLHDYSQVDPRLRQLAFLVKHWAKRRQVNETYRGTLSSYAYVLMCIHFLQQRRPAILPCLQSMRPTYEVTVATIKCSYYDKVNELKNFGARNKESVAELLTYFFEYWASCHDYNRWVISVRTGGYLSKDEKDWTRRIGNERHLICIEDPFEVTHDLGRVVDRHSIRVLRDEFKRAAKILRQDPNPGTTLFEPFIREKV